MFLELLIALWVNLTLHVGNVGGIFVIIAVAIPTVFLAVYTLNWSVNFFFGMEPAGLSKAPKPPTRREKRIRAMDAEDLAEMLARHPRDHDAREELCRKLKKKGDLESYAAECERLLGLNPNLDIEERSMRHHKLADLYAGPLKNPEKAKEILHDFIDNYSDSSQAQLMRGRLKRL